jgi:DNA polymerase-3 subunit delta'
MPIRAGGRVIATIAAMKNSHISWDIIGHQWAADMLTARLTAGRAGHAYLFTGIESLGKSLMALRLAQALNCTGGAPPCRACRACDLIERGQHSDVISLETDGAAIKIEAVRELIAGLTLRPVEARVRIGIVLNAERLTPSAADALLKTLEEPPETARLLLTARQIESLPLTIASRCQVIPLRPVPAAEIEAALLGRPDFPAKQAGLLARLSGGRPGWAIRAGAQPDLLAQRAEMLDGLLGALRSNRSGRFTFSEMIAARSGELPLILDLWQSWWRDVVLLAEGGPAEPVNVDQAGVLAEVAQAAGREHARAALDAVHQTAVLLADTNANARLALDVMLLKMPYLG